MRHLGSQGKWTADATIKLPEAATAVALAPKDSDGRYVPLTINPKLDQ